ncbi:MAG: hypothetical protein ACREC5_06550, partial [Thermoplasmata archaeon]
MTVPDERAPPVGAVAKERARQEAIRKRAWDPTAVAPEELRMGKVRSDAKGGSREPQERGGGGRDAVTVATTEESIGGKYGPRRLNRSAGPQDVRPGWQLESALRSIGPYVDYGTAVADRVTGEILWREGDSP